MNNLEVAKLQVERIERDAKAVLSQSKCYEVILSTKDRLKCDADELWRVIEAIKSGSPAKLRQGLFNPSYYVGIVLDEKRYSDYVSDINLLVRNNRDAIKHYNGEGIQNVPQFKQLRDIFEGIELKQLPESSNVKKLNEKNNKGYGRDVS